MTTELGLEVNGQPKIELAGRQARIRFLIAQFQHRVIAVRSTVSLGMVRHREVERAV